MTGWRSVLAFLPALVTAVPAATPTTPSGSAERRVEAARLFSDGNYKEALDRYRLSVLDPGADPRALPEDFRQALRCMEQLGDVTPADAFREQAAGIHRANFRLLSSVARSYVDLQHDGFIVAGAFERGSHRGGGEYAQANERDRARALALYLAAEPLVERDASAGERADFYADFARALLFGREGEASWRLQELSDLGEPPDVERGYHYYGGLGSSAPVHEDGTPVYYSQPESWALAQNDGERWRWLGAQVVGADPARRDEVELGFARFLRSQFGVETLRASGFAFDDQPSDDTDSQAGIYALHTLKDEETIARLASGIARFTPPREQNHVLLLQAIAARGGSGQREALELLADIFQNRRQLARAAETWRALLAMPPGNTDHYRAELDQIVSPWGRFEGGPPQPAGQLAKVALRFRNATRARLSAQRIDVERLIASVKAYLVENPKELDWRRIELGQIGWRLMETEGERFLTGEAQTWSEQLEPLADHFDRRVTLETPLAEAGAYLVSADFGSGHVARVIVWIEDVAIVTKPLDGGRLYFVADAATGAPLADAELEFFGYRYEQVDSKLWKALGRNQNIVTTSFVDRTDAEGSLVIRPAAEREAFQWLVVARAGERRLAYLGFEGLWFPRRYDEAYEADRVFAITDRPVYRPGQAVKYKLWQAHARYDEPVVQGGGFAGASVTVTVYNPRGEKVREETLVADAWGGVASELALPSGAPLGVWSVSTGNGGGTFRVEEYKKPEFEVTIEAPKEPVALGDVVEATIEARYYFGTPVTDARVKYKVLREEHAARWFPPSPWDWLYGPGYWWFGYDAPWFPGWRSWGCEAPIWWWWQRPSPPPEVVAESELPIGPDGKLKLRIDTGPAKALHGDSDHRYTITAEVVDASRRSIVGSGSLLVAREPFKIHVWLDRGYYRVDDAIEASFSARTPDSKPVSGTGELELRRVTYGVDRAPEEEIVQRYVLDTDAEGGARKQLKASRPGQYRLVYRVTDRQGRAREGGYLFSVFGEEPAKGIVASVSDWLGLTREQVDFRFSGLELVPDKAEYRPGDVVELLLNTDRKQSTVLLFIRPANGVYLPPRLLRLEGQSHVERIPVTAKDMPNFFVEAVTVSDGRVLSELREIVVPPAERVLELAVEPAAAELLPGAEATVALKLSDASGEPFAGSLVVSVYDKAVEYVSGGSNVPDIKEHFWKWRRQHYPSTGSSLERWFGNMVKAGELGMRGIGVFGETLGRADGAGAAGGAMKKDGFDDSAGGGPPQRSGLRQEAMAMQAPAALGMLAEAKESDGEAAPPPQGAEVQPAVRSEFADTAYWTAAIETDARGEATIRFAMPENLTTWRVRAWGMALGTRVGEGSAEVVTTKNVIVRLQAPRFFVEKDEVVLSANVHNELETAKATEVRLELAGGTLELIDAASALKRVRIEPGSAVRVDWRVRAVAEGEAVIRMSALTDEESDAVEQRFPVKVHGVMKQVAASAHLSADADRVSFDLNVPAERRPAESRLELRWSPSLALAMVDALPYLASYPYGCTEQTLSRFLPTVITQRVLIDMGLDLAAIRAKRTNLNAQELGDDAARAADRLRARRIVGYDDDGHPIWDDEPVFDPERVADMAEKGLARLANMQLSDGGWGWFSGWGEHSSAHTTAYVVHGLQIAASTGLELPSGLLDRGVGWLEAYQAGELRKLANAARKSNPYKQHADDLDAFVFMVLGDAGKPQAAMRAALYRDRTMLQPYTLAMFGLALERLGATDELAMVKRNIEQYLKLDAENQTAWLELPGSAWWAWYGSEFEAHAYYLKLLAATEPRSDKAAWLVKYLLNNRRLGGRWNSTRDTAIIIEALADYTRAAAEDRPDMTVEVRLDGRTLKTVHIDQENLFSFDGALVLEGAAVTTGNHRIELVRQGKGPLYVNGYLSYFSLEDPIGRAGLELKVERHYYKLVRVDATASVPGAHGQALAQKVERYERQPLAADALLQSGDLVEVELIVESKNDYEYVILEDLKPAGFEPVDVRSGYTDNALGAYVEFRDDRAAFFVTALARGRHSVAYRTRAEIPGRFSALPARGYAMYAPELKANADEMKLRIED